MQLSNNIFTRVNDWHGAAVTGQKQVDDVAKPTDGGRLGDSSVLDKFVTNFEELSKLDQSDLDTARDPGTVQAKTPSGTKSLRKTDDGFVITTENDSEERTQYKRTMGIWFNDQTTTFVLNEKTQTLTMAQERPNGTLFMVEQDLSEPVGDDAVDKSSRNVPDDGRPRPALPKPSSMVGVISPPFVRLEPPRS